jgi:RNA polymerase sigma factor (sigma-70 family)
MLQQKTKQTEFRDLFQPYLPSLKNTAFRLTRDAIESEDLLQETLYKAYRAFSSFKPGTNFRAWIFKILLNTYLTQYRKRAKQPLHLSYNDMESYTLYQQSDLNFDSPADQKDTVGGELFGDEIYTVMEKLPYYFRLVILLYDIEGFTYNEISQMIRIPVGTVMSRLNRGRSLLRRKLKNYAKARGYGIENKLQVDY